MGLLGAIVVRPAGYDAATPATWRAYAHDDSLYDHEYLFLLTEIDPEIHEAVERGDLDRVDTAKFFPVYWFINGRAAPDTMADANVPWLPNQPYNCMPQAHPGEKVLMRMVGGGRDLHPFHTHGNHHDVIARNGRLLGSAPAAGADNAEQAFTSTVFPGQTLDALYSWTGEGLGWDAYGHVDRRGPAAHRRRLRDRRRGARSRRVARRPLQADPRRPPRPAGADLRPVVQRHPVPRDGRQPAARATAA